MRRFLSGFFLPLCIFLLSGYGQRYALAYQAGTDFSSIRIFGKPAVETDAGLNRYALVIKSAPTEKKTFRLDIAPLEEDEVKEDELNSSKKHAGTSLFLTSNSCGQTPVYFLGCSGKSLLFYSHFSNITSCKWYLVFQVFRI